jgi:hypothetical protein
MTLVHYARAGLALEDVRSIEQVTFKESNPHSWHKKPRGLWVSVLGADDWRAFCVGRSDPHNHFVRDLAVATEIVLVDGANVPVIGTFEQLRAFGDRYELVPQPFDYGGATRGWLDWIKAATEIDGVIIAPWQEEAALFDMQLFWYHGWDCASGVVWNRAAIAACIPRPDLAIAPGSVPCSTA